MKIKSSKKQWIALGVLALVSLPLEADGPPSGVSPGTPSRVTAAPSACPAFSWTEVSDARGYEIVVYQITAEGEAPREILKQKLPAGATSWTPSLDRCLTRGERYGWTVRALISREDSEWSPPNLFEVAAGPTEDDFEAALEVVRNYLGDHGTGPISGQVTPPSASPPSPAAPVSGETPSPLTPPPPGTQLAVDGNVHATSFSGDGSTLSGVATTGNLSAHAGNAVAHHTPTVDTNCHGNPCDGSAFTGLDADQLTGGTVAEPRVDSLLARDTELFAALDSLDCHGTQVVQSVDSLGRPQCREIIVVGDSTTAGLGTAIGPAGPAALYPSTTTVSFVSGDVIEVEVKLWDLSHSRPDDLDILLVAPNGESVLLMSDAGGEDDLTQVHLTIGDKFQPMPDSGPLLSVHSPTDYDPASDNFPAPAPAGPYATSLSTLAGLEPNGDWKLYIRDDEPSEGGDLGSWAVRLITLPENINSPASAELAAHEANASAHHVQPTSLPPSGTAGGDLMGSYPNPALGADTVSTSEIMDGTIVEADLAFDPATQAELDAVAPTGECEGFAINGRRFIDRGDGTVRDCDTGKIWLRDAGCLGNWPWADVGDTIFTKINELNSAVDFGCGDYVAGTYTDWEVPDIATLEGIVDSAISGTPKVYNGKGDAGWTPGNVFLAIQGSLYWSATEVDPTDASCVGMNNATTFSCGKTVSHALWAVRSD